MKNRKKLKKTKTEEKKRKQKIIRKGIERHRKYDVVCVMTDENPPYFLYVFYIDKETFNYMIIVWNILFSC